MPSSRRPRALCLLVLLGACSSEGIDAGEGRRSTGDSAKAGSKDSPEHPKGATETSKDSAGGGEETDTARGEADREQADLADSAASGRQVAKPPGSLDDVDARDAVARVEREREIEEEREREVEEEREREIEEEREAGAISPSFTRTELGLSLEFTPPSAGAALDSPSRISTGTPYDDAVFEPPDIDLTAEEALDVTGIEFDVDQAGRIRTTGDKSRSFPEFDTDLDL